MRMMLLRLAALALTATILPSCRKDHDEWVWVTVTNQGTVSASVKAESEGYWDAGTVMKFTVEPGGWSQVRFLFDGLTRLEVHVYRSTDADLLFSGTWDHEELDDLHRRVEITVSP